MNVVCQSLRRSLSGEPESTRHIECLRASNTSTLPITRLAEHRSNPSEFIGMHFSVRSQGCHWSRR
ncbi:3-hydroxyacyl-CoA dehydrogenase NAD-binding domain-containing protein [Nocardia sp. NPDC057030]|uniref:3-hydroxyacyl-CoA dehydrogenase NAD-binding domain-containing protein n=1 Tax=unclassified Nocardia TaxID=2637762 RepID=UPI0036385FCC